MYEEISQQQKQGGATYITAVN